VVFGGEFVVNCVVGVVLCGVFLSAEKCANFCRFILLIFAYF
jgi:hypothetical protein